MTLALLLVILWLACGLATLRLCFWQYGPTAKDVPLFVKAVGIALTVLLWPLALWDVVN